MIIRTLREDRGWSQEQLAETSGVSVRTIQRIEQGGRASLETLKCLAAVFETTIPELRREDRMPTNIGPDAPGPVENSGPVSRLKTEDLPGLSDDDETAGSGTQHPRKSDKRNLASEESRVLTQVRRERGFYILLAGFLAIIGFLFVLNMMTSPNTLWVIWPAFGMGVATVFYAIQVFGPTRALGDEWERSQVEKRLRQIADRAGQR